MKKKTKEKWEMAIIFVVTIIVIIGGIYFWDKSEREKESCLEPHALEICQERGLHYYSHSSYVTFCKEDIRDYDSLRFKFNRTEKSNCGMGGFEE